MQRLSVNREEPLYKYAIGFMEHHWGTKGIFPGCQPVSIEFRHFDILRSQPYLVCEKTDGVRCMLLAFMFENKKVCVLLNRALDMFLCPLNFRKSVYEGSGSILDGELYENEIFMVYDALMVCGTVVGQYDFLSRLKHIEEMKKLLTVLKYDPIKIQLKTFHLLTDFKTFMSEYLPTVTQKIDGLIFTPVKTWVKIGTHETMFKWKPREKNTIDFQMKKKGNLWRLYVQERGKLVFESELKPHQIPNEPWVEEDAIVECQYMFQDEPMWWKPLMRRRDKTYPNGRRTFYRTLVNIKEDIKMEDFLNCT
jgi:hypothetical protein